MGAAASLPCAEAAESRFLTPRDFLRALRQRLDEDPTPDWPSLQTSEAVVHCRDGDSLVSGRLSRTLHPVEPPPPTVHNPPPHARSLWVKVQFVFIDFFL